MRDLLDLLDNILTESQIDEATLSASQIKKYPQRFAAFIDHIQNQRPFYTEAGDEVVLNPAEADRFLELDAQGKFSGGLKGVDLQGRAWPLSAFLKTAEFGGSSLKPGEEGDVEKIKKENAKLKPTQIGITDKQIPAGDLGDMIVNNPVLQSTDYGRAVIAMAQQIMSGETAVIPEEFRKNAQIKTSIVDYAGEYLGVLALVSGQTDFPKKKEFVKWLGGDLSGLMLYFPSKSNTQLADSFATVTDTASGHTINISSKGTGGGAAPSITGIKIPDHIREKEAYRSAVELIELAQGKGLPKPASISSVFGVMNHLGETVPDAVPATIRQYLPFPDDITDQVQSSRANGTAMPEYEDLFRDLKSTGSDGGKLTYVVKKTVMNLINSDAVPEFQDVVLEVLDYNFIQQYASSKGRAGEMYFLTQWPAKLDGQVTLETKSGGTDPTKGGFSFKLQPRGGAAADLAEPVDDIPGGAASVTSTGDLDAVTQQRSKIKASGMTDAPAGAKEPIGTKQTLGRARRR